MTTVIQIGNSDDKLTQAQWSKFYEHVDGAVIDFSLQVHFSGASYPSAPWQNAAWVFEIEEGCRSKLRKRLIELCMICGQDSIAWTEGQTVFVTANDEPKDL